MDKPTFPQIIKITPEEIKATRHFYRKTQEQFGRFFPVSGAAIKKWESGDRNPYGPGAARLQELKAYADMVKAEKAEALKGIMGR